MMSEELIDDCVMECHFRDHKAERGLLFHDTVSPHLAALQKLHTLEPIRIIEGKA